jgi:lipoprotein-releasing system permease protein
MYLSFAWRYFKAKKSTNAINVIAWVTTCVIAFATCCQVLVLSVFNGFEDLVKSLYSSFYADIKIVPASGKTLTLASTQLQQLKDFPFVKGISMAIEEKALLKNEEEQTVITMKGVDNNYANVSGLPSRIVKGNFDPGTTDEPRMIIGSGIQNAAGIVLNPAFAPENMVVILPRRIKSADPLELLSEGHITPSGVFTIQQEFDNNYAITNIGFMKQQMNIAPDEFSAAEISLKNDANIKTSQETLQQLLGNKYIVQTRYEQNTSLYATMKMEKWAIYGILTLILLIAAFNMVSALTMLVLEKKQDIQILQSMGSSGSLVRRIFMSEGLLLGGIGAFIGVALAIIICLFQLKFKLIKLQGGSFLIDYFPVKLIATDFLLVLSTALVISLLASWFPAYKASRQPFLLR